MGVLLHQQSGNEHKLDFFVWNLAQNKPKKVLKVDVCGSSRFTTRKLAIFGENLKKPFNFRQIWWKAQKIGKIGETGRNCFLY